MEAEKRKTAAVTCPKCGRKFGVLVPQQKPILHVKCPGCQHDMHINFGNPKPIRVATPEAQPSQAGTAAPHEAEAKTRQITIEGGRGKLVQLRGFFRRNITHSLVIGENTIGRYDLAQPSQIMIKGDASVSRRSVSIHVKMQGGGMVYSLRVLKSANPVLLQGRELAQGEETYLNFGDIIQLGRTKFRFEKKDE